MGQNKYLCPTHQKQSNMNIKIFIRERGKDTENVLFRLKDGRTIDLHLKSDIIINSKDFNNKSGDVILPKSRIKDEQTTKLLDKQKKVSEVKTFIQNWYIEQPIKENLSSSDLALSFDKWRHPEKYAIVEDEQVPETVLSYIKYFVENADKRKDKKTSRLLSPNTKKQYVTTEKHLIAFAKHQKKNDYQFSEINEQFYTDFVDYLTNKKYTVKTKRGEEINEIHRYTLNSVGKYIRALKVMIASAKHPDADTTSFYVFNEDVDNVYLNETELQQLKDFDFSDVPHLERVRDWFLLLAWTGSRYSDLDKIEKSKIKNGLITYRQKKTNTLVTIPMHPVVNDILQKYNFDMPELISNQKFNDYIKEACKAAKIDDVESITRTVGGKLITETMPKFELVSSHTCRRSFCTNMYLRGLDTMMIRSISGHKTEKSFLKYIKVSQQQHAEMMAKKWSEIYK